MSEALQKLILDTLDAESTIKDTRSLVLPGQTASASSNEDQIVILGALNSLLSREVGALSIFCFFSIIHFVQMIKYETHEVLTHVPTPEGALILKDGSHEARVWKVLPAKGFEVPMSPAQLKKEVGDETAKVGQGRAFKNGWIAKEGDGLVKLVRLHRN